MTTIQPDLDGNKSNANKTTLLEPASETKTSTFITEAQTMESCSSWSSSSSNTSLQEFESSNIPPSPSNTQDDDHDNNNSTIQPADSIKNKNPMNLTIQTSSELVESSSICNSPTTPPLSTPASFASSSILDSTQREKRLLDECWDRILIQQFHEINSPSSLYGKDTVHSRLHQLVILSGNDDTRALARTLASGANRIFLQGTPSYHSKHSMEPLYVFSNMMKQLSSYFNKQQQQQDNQDSLQLQASTSFGSDCSLIKPEGQQSLEPMVALFENQFSSKEQTMLVRTFSALQPFFPKASAMASPSPTPDIWTRKAPTVAGSYQYQFHVAMKRFLNLLTLPIIMVVDDWQLVDEASLDLLDFLLAAQPSLDDDNNKNGILFVLCYNNNNDNKDNESSHHCYYTPHGQETSSTATTTQEHNNLFTTLNYCHEMGIRRLPHYDFELTEIIMSSDIVWSPSSHLSKPPQQLLLSLSPLDLQVAKYAACLAVGDRIPLDLLEIVYDAFMDAAGTPNTPKRHSQVAPNVHLLFEHLARLISHGILEWKPTQMTMVWTSSQLVKEALRLVHQEEDKKEWFRIIVDGLLEGLSEQQREYWIYLIADLHNAAGIVVAREIQSASLAKLNQQAALRAIQSGSLIAAGHYLNQAIRALKHASKAKKHHHQDLEQSLNRLWMQVSAYTNNDVGLRVASSHLLVEDKQGFLEKLMIHQTQFSGLLSSCSINPNSTHIAQQGANRCFQLMASDLAMKFPTKDLVQGVTVSKGLMKLKSQSKAKTNQRALQKIPVMDKPIQLAAMKLLDTCANFCYMAGDVRFPLVVLKSIELFQKYGLSIYAPMVHALVGVLMVVALEDPKAGIAYANYSLSLWTLPHFEANAVQMANQAQTISLSHFVVLPWANSFSSLLQPLRDAYELALQGGDMDIAAQVISNYAVLAFLSGRELSILNKELCYYVNQLRRYNR